MNLFQVVPNDFFKPLTSKYKETYMDCLVIIYHTYRSESSFGVEKDTILSNLENYFEQESKGEMIFEDEEVANNARAQAQATLRNLEACGWIENEVVKDYKIKVNLLDYAVTMIESFQRIIANDELEYQSLISQIHATLTSERGYDKPYEYIIKSVVENTDELINGLKKLNTNIKKYIEAITADKSAGEIIDDFFNYHTNIGSKAYHRIKTSDNISYFRTGIIENLRKILNDEEIFAKAVQGLREVELIDNIEEAEGTLRSKLQYVISTYRNYDEIIAEIDEKNTKYIESAIGRAKFLLNHTNNTEGKIQTILAHLADAFNDEESLNLNDESSEALLTIFSIFPQNFVDSDSLYSIPISRKMGIPEELNLSLEMSQEERELRKRKLYEKNKKRFSKKNITRYVDEILKNQRIVLASTLPLESKRDLIRIVFIDLYSRDEKMSYKVKSADSVIEKGQYRFEDFYIERRNG